MSELLFIFIINQGNMSFLIEYQGMNLCSQPRPQLNIPQQYTSNNHSTHPSDDEITQILDKIASSVSMQSAVISYSKTEITLNFILPSAIKEVFFKVKVSLQRSDLTVKISYLLINSNQSFLAINSSQRRLFASKLLSFFNKVDPLVFNQNKITIQMQSGLLRIQNPHFYELSFPVNKSLAQKINFLLKMFINNIPTLHQIIFTLIQVSNINLKGCMSGIICKNDGVRMKKIIKYSRLLNIVLSLGTEQTSDEQSLTRNMKTETESIEKISSNFVKVDLDFDSSALYYSQHLSFISKTPFLEMDYSLTENETIKIKSKLEMSQVTTMKNSSERIFVVNHIKLIKMNENNMIKLAQGGFAKIFLAQVQHQSINSHQLGKQQDLKNRVLQPVKRRHFVVKRQIMLNSFRKSRIMHEKELLAKIKSALAIFIPRYYFIFNQSEQHRYDLIQDHIYLQSNTFDLGEYIKKYQSSLSQQTKVYFAYSILQALRYLKEYKIAHLDIKPGNVMIGKKLVIKLIDFGESYHPDFKNHKPGVSMPYSPPENYQPQEDYNHKNDVFSFGVLFHYLLTNKYPFFFYSDKDRSQVFKNNTLSQRWFFTPEGMTIYGEHSLFPLFQLIIGKCLDPDPQRRPQLEWIYLILREYLQLFR